jgi:hypothetical protein
VVTEGQSCKRPNSTSISISLINFATRFRSSISRLDFAHQFCYSIPLTNFATRFRSSIWDSISLINFRTRFRSSISRLDFAHQFRDSISLIDFANEFCDSISLIDFATRFRSSISRLDSAHQFRDSFLAPLPTPPCLTPFVAASPPKSSSATHPNPFPLLSVTLTLSARTSALPATYPSNLSLHSPPHPCVHLPLPSGIPLTTSLDCPPFIRTVSHGDSATTDLTGQLPVESRRGNQYILVTVFNGYIHLTAQTSRSASDYVSSFDSILAFYTAHSLPIPSLITSIDNETSLECKEYFLSQRLPVQFVPPQIHRTNPAERAVRTAKTHLIVLLSSTHPDVPDDLWDRLLPHAEITLNLLRP